MQRIKIVLQYDGSYFSGWQKQKKSRSIQEEIEKALFKLFGKETLVTGSSRTDAGVHALGQVCHFDCDEKFPVKNLCKAINAFLPDDIRVIKAYKVKVSFNARFDVIKKTYIYVLSNQNFNPIFRKYYTTIDYPLNESKMKDCMRLFLGKHNFKGFCSSSAQVKNFEREIFEAKLTKKFKCFVFEFTGNGFLQHMIRILVGTVVDVGRGKLTLEQVKECLRSYDRSLSGKTMPPNGLYLKKIFY